MAVRRRICKTFSTCKGSKSHPKRLSTTLTWNRSKESFQRTITNGNSFRNKSKWTKMRNKCTWRSKSNLTKNRRNSWLNKLRSWNYKAERKNQVSKTRMFRLSRSKKPRLSTKMSMKLSPRFCCLKCLIQPKEYQSDITTFRYSWQSLCFEDRTTSPQATFTSIWDCFITF